MKPIYIILFLVYLAVLVKVILFKDSLFFDLVPTNETYQKKSESKSLESYNLVPFRTIRGYLKYADQKTRFYNLYGNIILFIPFGFFLPLVFQKAQRFGVTFFCSVLLSTFFELYQQFSNTGHADIDDIILNTTGGLIGYLFIALYFRKKERKHVLHPQ